MSLPSEQANETEYLPIHPGDVAAFNRVADHLYNIAARMGWHDRFKDNMDRVTTFVANEHGEVSELWEALRNGKLNEPCDKAEKMKELGLEPLTCLEEEIADIVIRALDTAASMGINIGRAIVMKSELNRSRGYRYGGKLA